MIFEAFSLLSGAEESSGVYWSHSTAAFPAACRAGLVFQPVHDVQSVAVFPQKPEHSSVKLHFKTKPALAVLWGKSGLGQQQHQKGRAPSSPGAGPAVRFVDREKPAPCSPAWCHWEKSGGRMSRRTQIGSADLLSYLRPFVSSSWSSGCMQHLGKHEVC